MIELNEDQMKAKDLILSWINNNVIVKNEDIKQTFVLSGYAGTGKTTLIQYIINNELENIGLRKHNISIATPTGKASLVLIQKGMDSSTIHKLIYHYTEKEYQYEDENGVKHIKKKYDYKKKNKLSSDCKLIIIDEVSMVSYENMKDLLSFNIPILAIGDSFQLPAIFKSNDLLKTPNYTLTQIVRQTEDNMIIKLANEVRVNRFKIDLGKYGDNIIVLNERQINEQTLLSIMSKADQVICGKNSTRSEINNRIRTYLGHKTEYPEDGEKLICDTNNYDVFLDNNSKFSMVNGTIGYVMNFKIVDKTIGLAKFDLRADFLTEYSEDIISDAAIFKENEFKYDKHQIVYLLPKNKYVLKKRMKRKSEYESSKDFFEDVKQETNNKMRAIDEITISQLEYGYCISCHKSQGSEFDTVVIIDESDVFGEFKYRWLYTAITRAKKKLIIIKK